MEKVDLIFYNIFSGFKWDKVYFILFKTFINLLSVKYMHFKIDTGLIHK